MIDYIRDGQEIYRNSFAIIRAEANLDSIPADLEKLAVRVIHACGMVDAIEDLRFSPGAGKAGRDALAAGAAILCDARMVSEGVAPNPKEPSRRLCGTALMMSSDSEDTNGMTISPITIPAVRTDDEELPSPSGCAK